MFFFFKQKTAYEMRSSDWSSDVCSSDLQKAGQEERGLSAEDGPAKAVDDADNRVQVVEQAPLWRDHTGTEADRRNVKSELHNERSEEHTSELKSLMRNSYAVFCLKKKKKIRHIQVTLKTNTHKSNTSTKETMTKTTKSIQQQKTIH